MRRRRRRRRRRSIREPDNLHEEELKVLETFIKTSFEGRQVALPE